MPIQKQTPRPAWMSAAVYGGMAMTMGGVGVAQFMTHEGGKTTLVVLAILGIALSMAPFWEPNLRRWRTKLGHALGRMEGRSR